MKRYDSYKPSGISWIGDIPSHWEMKKIKYIVDSIQKGKGISKEEIFDDGDIQCVRYGEIYSKYNHSFKECISATKQELNNAPCYFYKGDILCAGTGELVEEIGKSIVYLGEKPGLVGGDIILIRHNQNPSFLNYSLNSHNIQIQKSQGKAKLKVVHISASEIGNVMIPLPPIEEQDKIVKFLSTKTLIIDAQQRERERELRLLEELKQTEMANVVTRGLDPNVPMKDSGIPWIGKIPEHWELRKIRSLYKQRNEKVSDKDYEPLSVSKQGVTHQLEDAVKTDNGDNRKLVRKGDFVVNSRSDRKGSCGVSSLDGSVSLINIVLEPIEEICDNFYHNLFRSNNYIEEFYRRGKGIVADLWTTKFDEMRNIVVPFPPIEEQRAIVEYIEQKNKAIDDMIADLKAEIDFLTEYKQRLISDAVTGQIDVRDYESTTSAQ